MTMSSCYDIVLSTLQSTNSIFCYYLHKRFDTLSINIHDNGAVTMKVMTVAYCIDIKEGIVKSCSVVKVVCNYRVSLCSL